MTGHGRGVVSLFRWLPGVQAVRSYRREWLQGDIVAGVRARDAAGPAGHDEDHDAFSASAHGHGHGRAPASVGWEAAAPSSRLLMRMSDAKRPYVVKSGSFLAAAPGRGSRLMARYQMTLPSGVSTTLAALRRTN